MCTVNSHNLQIKKNSSWSECYDQMLDLALSPRSILIPDFQIVLHAGKRLQMQLWSNSLGGGGGWGKL